MGPTQALLLAGQEAVEQWAPLTYHPGLLTPRSCFVTDELASRPALFFVHEHLPGAASLHQVRYSNPLTSRCCEPVANACADEEMDVFT